MVPGSKKKRYLRDRIRTGYGSHSNIPQECFRKWRGRGQKKDPAEENYLILVRVGSLLKISTTFFHVPSSCFFQISTALLKVVVMLPTESAIFT